MKKLILTTAVLALSAWGANAQQVVRMGTEGAYPPYNFVNDKGEVDGFRARIWRQDVRMESLKCEWVTNEWDSIIPNLVSGNYDRHHRRHVDH